MNIIDEIKRNRRCNIFPVNNKLPPLPYSHLVYPDDLVCFYNICGGAMLFEAGKCNVYFEILSPDNIVRTNFLYWVKGVCLIFHQRGARYAGLIMVTIFP